MPDTITTAVPQQTPPQDSILHPAQVYFLSRRLPGIVHLVQYDQSLPYLAVELYEGDEPYTVPDGAAVNIRMAKPVPSTKKVYNPAYGISEDRHTVYIAVTPQMTVVAGCTNPVIEVVVDGDVACTGTLRLEIDPNPVQESDLIDTDEYKTLEEILAEVQAAAQIVQDNEQALQDVHNNLQAIRNAAANAQAAAASAQDAEDAADRAAIESQKALGFRSYFGGQVVPDSDGDLDPSRPMSTPTAASVTIKARGDRIAGLTMAGKTTQAGTGDPSPDNIRPIAGVGMWDQCVVFDGSEDEDWQLGSTGTEGKYTLQIIAAPQVTNVPGTRAAPIKSDRFRTISATGTWDNQTGIAAQANKIYIYSEEYQNVQSWKSNLAEHPLTVWYQSVNYKTHTGPWYTVVELSKDPCRAVGFELNQPLFDGDSLKVGGKSGFDQMVVLDGSTEITANTEAASGIPFSMAYFDMPVVAGSNPSFFKSTYLRSVSGVGATGYPGFVVTTIASTQTVQINFRIEGVDSSDSSEVTDYLSAHPLTVFYKSTEYTEEADIPVALESHVMGYAVFDGTENWSLPDDGFARLQFPDAKAISDVEVSDDIMSHYTFVYNDAQIPLYRFSWGRSNSHNLLINTGFDSAEEFKDFLSAQKAAGTPVQVVYELNTPASYARLVPMMIAEPGEDGTFTVTGENTLSVRLKAFQDGGDAATIEGHTWADILAAIQSAIAPTAQALMEGKTDV